MYNLNLDNFSGPFDLLLKLLDEKKMDIKDVSLVAVTDQFLEFIKTREKIEIENLASFLAVAARLLFLKSKAILPSLEIIEDEEDEGESLEKNLERYKEVKEMALKLKSIAESGFQMFSREYSAKNIQGFYPPQNLTAEELGEIFSKVVQEYQRSTEEIRVLQEESIQEIVSLEEKIIEIQKIVERKEKKNFNEIIGNSSRVEIAVSFLALLELIKQDLICVCQGCEFGEICLTPNPSPRV